jgi:hypothetical protein
VLKRLGVEVSMSEVWEMRTLGGKAENLEKKKA